MSFGDLENKKNEWSQREGEKIDEGFLADRWRAVHLMLEKTN